VAVTWALGALQALALLATGLALVGVLLFVASRQRETQISYALARRMGLRPTQHRAALSGEVLALLAIALLVATLLGVLAAALVAGGIDPLPDLRPAPRTAWPLQALSVLTAILVVAGLAGAALLQRRADRADVAEVLRRG
jgi:putative ABC transport system permease protein